MSISFEKNQRPLVKNSSLLKEDHVLMLVIAIAGDCILKSIIACVAGGIVHTQSEENGDFSVLHA